MIHSPEILVAMEQWRRAELIAAADEFRRAKQVLVPRKPRWRRRRTAVGVNTPGLSAQGT